MKTTRQKLVAAAIAASLALGILWLCNSGESDPPVGMYFQQPVFPGTIWQAPAGGFGSGGGDNFWSTGMSAGNCNTGNTQGYVHVPGVGTVGYGF